MTTDIHRQEALMAVTDRLLTDEAIDLDRVERRYGVPRAEIEGFLGVIDGLNSTLTEVQPSHKFARRLKQDLMGKPEVQTLGWRLRRMPMRVQVAAVFTAAIGGVTLLVRRYVLRDKSLETPQQDTEEAHVLR